MFARFVGWVRWEIFTAACRLGLALEDDTEERA